MKIKLGTKPRGDVLCILIIATIVVVSAGVAIYHLCKWAKRCDNGEPAPFPGTTNSEAIPTPGNGNGADITAIWWENPVMYAWWWETNQYGSPPPAQDVTTNKIITGILNGTNMLLSIVEGVFTNGLSTRFSDMGMPVDEYGLPSDLSWQLNMPTGEAQDWVLQRSTNLWEWQDMLQWKVWPGLTNSFMDGEMTEGAFYRARR